MGKLLLEILILLTEQANDEAGGEYNCKAGIWIIRLPDS